MSENIHQGGQSWRMAHLLTPRKVITGLAVLVLAYLFVWPFVMLVIGAFLTTPYGGGEWTLDGFRTVLNDPRALRSTLSSFLFSGLVMVISIAGGLFFAIITSRFKLRFGWLVLPAMVLIACTPRLFYAFAWGMMGNPGSGFAANILRYFDIANPAWLTVYSWPGLVLVSSMKVTAVAYLLLSGPVRLLDRSLEDAAVMCGQTRLRAFFSISLPLLAPSLLAIGMLLFVEGIQVFDFPAVLGSPAGITTLSTLINDFINTDVTPKWGAANALSLVVVVVIALLILLQSRLLGGRDFASVGGKARGADTAEIGKLAVLFDAIIVAFFAVAFVLPFLQILIGSLQPYFGLYTKLTTANYVAVIKDRDTLDALVSSLLISVGGGFLVVTLSFVMIYVMQRSKSRPTVALLKILSWLPATAPGIVLSIAFVWAYLSTPLVRSLYGTPFLMLIALVIAHVPIAARACEGIIVQVSTSLDEAARVSGAGPWRAAAEITARLCTPSLLGAWLLISLAISGALDVVMMLQTTNTQMVATLSYSMFNNGDVAEAAALYVLFIGLLIAFMAALIGLMILLRTAASGFHWSGKAARPLAMEKTDV
ncbi:ABC transporter permease subunit [Sulfitobacter sp. PR48]|uniref:ABC transporter permease n=1 Tax=Sulfitobacter sp. PR48 TaxID=3028383 RepID=UPI00237B0733|nr:ABC transporter permease subunit [Sulfitobacter sp. PR48]MDD9720922.1 ABC transporter permease subunit [Sulfitobacter sp. PR48]